MEMPKERTNVVMVLDKSGSMASIKDITIRGFNEHLQTLNQQAQDGTEIYASLILFDSKVVAQSFNVSVRNMQELTDETYKPDGGTAMFDAVGNALERLESDTDINDENNSYLVMVFSDGEENSSKVWTSAKLAERIQDLQKTNRWTFTYVGANQDLSVIQKTLNLQDNNMYKGWASNNASSATMNSASSASLGNYMRCRKLGMKSVEDFYDPKNAVPIDDEKKTDLP
jgi:uncharacterized protein YegL